MSHRFEADHGPLAERLNDEELREVLERLGEAQFGSDERATVGAVVEATGANAAMVLRILGEIRHRALEGQREAVETLERRVSRLETRRSGVREEPLPQRGGLNDGVIVAIALALGIGLLLFGALASARPHHPYGDSTWSMSTSDGKVEMGPDGTVRVIRSDGSFREPTVDERIQVESFAAATASPGSESSP